MNKLTETRGREAKYNYDAIPIDGYIVVDITAGGILSSAKGWALRNKKKHKFKVRTEESERRLYRIK